MPIMPNQGSGEGAAGRGKIKRAEILAYSARVIAEEGYEKASIRKIAAAMGMSVSALYYYFASKEDLLFSIQYHAFDNLVGRLERTLREEIDPERRLYLLIENHLQFFLARLNELVICSHEINTLGGQAYDRVLERRRRYYRIALGVVKGVIKNEADDALDAPIATLNLMGMLNWIYMWYDPDKNPSYRELAREIYNLFLNGIRFTDTFSPQQD